MHVQINTDRNVEGSLDLESEIRAVVRAALERFADRVTRVEVHLNDVNSHKGGQNDKRCVIEARLAGLAPIAVSHNADSVPLAIAGAADKLVRSLDSTLGRLADADRRPLGRAQNQPSGEE